MAALVEKDVGGLDVPVDDAVLLLQVVQRLHRLCREWVVIYNTYLWKYSCVLFYGFRMFYTSCTYVGLLDLRSFFIFFLYMYELKFGGEFKFNVKFRGENMGPDISIN